MLLPHCRWHAHLGHLAAGHAAAARGRVQASPPRGGRSSWRSSQAAGRTPTAAARAAPRGDGAPCAAGCGFAPSRGRLPQGVRPRSTILCSTKQWRAPLWSGRNTEKAVLLTARSLVRTERCCRLRASGRLPGQPFVENGDGAGARWGLLAALRLRTTSSELRVASLLRSRSPLVDQRRFALGPRAGAACTTPWS